MNKSQALNYFWNSFGLLAFDENSVPEKIPDNQGRLVPLPFPYITYTNITDSLNNVVMLSASIWDRNTSWERISLKSEEIAKAIGEHGYYSMKLDNGYVWFVKGSPFAQRMSDPEKDIKRIYLNVQAEFLTAY